MTKKELRRIIGEQHEAILEIHARMKRLEDHLKLPWDGPNAISGTMYRVARANECWRLCASKRDVR